MTIETAPTEAGEPVDLQTVLAHITAMARNSDAPPLLGAGTFAIYGTKEGGLVLVLDNRDGELPPGTHHVPVSPRLLQAAAAFASGDKLGAIKAFTRRGK